MTTRSWTLPARRLAGRRRRRCCSSWRSHSGRIRPHPCTSRSSSVKFPFCWLFAGCSPAAYLALLLWELAARGRRRGAGRVNAGCARRGRAGRIGRRARLASTPLFPPPAARRAAVDMITVRRVVLTVLLAAPWAACCTRSIVPTDNATADRQGQGRHPGRCRRQATWSCARARSASTSRPTTPACSSSTASRSPRTSSSAPSSALNQRVVHARRRQGDQRLTRAGPARDATVESPGPAARNPRRQSRCDYTWSFEVH